MSTTSGKEHLPSSLGGLDCIDPSLLRKVLCDTNISGTSRGFFFRRSPSKPAAFMLLQYIVLSDSNWQRISISGYSSSGWWAAEAASPSGTSCRISFDCKGSLVNGTAPHFFQQDKLGSMENEWSNESLNSSALVTLSVPPKTSRGKSTTCRLLLLSCWA
jgi:hypothetical protein